MHAQSNVPILTYGLCSVTSLLFTIYCQNKAGFTRVLSLYAFQCISLISLQYLFAKAEISSVNLLRQVLSLDELFI